MNFFMSDYLISFVFIELLRQEIVLEKNKATNYQQKCQNLEKQLIEKSNLLQKFQEIFKNDHIDSRRSSRTTGRFISKARSNISLCEFISIVFY